LALMKEESPVVNEILDFLDGVLDGSDDPQSHQRHDQKRVKNRDRQVPAQTFPGIGRVALADDFGAALLHQDKAQKVGEPITRNETGGKGRFKEPAHDPGEGQRDRPINEQVVPPGKRREHVADEGQGAAGNSAFYAGRICHVRASLAGRGMI